MTANKSAPHITEHPVLADLAELIDTRNQPNPEAMTAVMPSSR